MHLCIDTSGSTVRGRLPSGHGGARAHERRSEPGAARAAVPARALPAAAERARSIASRASRRSTHPSSYIGLWSRVEGFELAELTKALERRKVVQGTLLRSTIHLVSAGDYWPFAIGTRAARQEAWLRFDKKRLSRSDLTSAAKDVRKTLSRQGPAPRRASRPGAQARPRTADAPLERARRLDRAGARPAFRDVGATPRRPLRPRRRVARASDRDTRGERRDPRTPLPDRLRAGAARRRRELGGPRPDRRPGGCRKPSPAALPRRGGPRARRPAACPAPRRLDDRHRPRFLPTWDATLLVHARGTQILPERVPPARLRHEDAALVLRRSSSTARSPESGRSNATRQEGNAHPRAVRPLPAAAKRELKRRGRAARPLHEPDAESYRVA